ncbi:MAG: hypothetical protein H0W73_08685 [Bacteroidetes bacterium]|nr:hypothetical protein [Bacteroidota bacterium]
MNSGRTKVANLNKAIEEAIGFGFTKQLLLVNGMIKKLISDKKIFERRICRRKNIPYRFR